MEQNSWQNTVMALVLFVACVLGCSKSAADVPKTQSAENERNSGNSSITAGQDIAGSYDVTGTNEDGSRYKGSLEVIKHGDVFQFRWNAGNQYDGVGVTNGPVVAVAFSGGSNGKGCGIVSYRVVDDATLDGKWGYWGVDQSGTENATRTSGASLAGDYNVTGKNPNGGQYKGTMKVAPKAGGYTFDWSNGSTGFGIKQGDNVSVGIGGSRCAFVAYEIKPDGMLDGVWGGYGSYRTGTEKATKK